MTGVAAALRRGSAVVAWLVIPALTSCQSPPDGGLRTPEPDAPAPASWFVSPTPLVSIGKADGPPEYQFGRIGSVVRREDGGFVVSDEVAGVIQWYDRNGSFVMRLARRGSGPGEFRAVTRLSTTAGDTIVLWDGALRRTTRFLPNGKPGDSRVVDLAPYAALAARPLVLTAVTPLSSGDVLVYLGAQPAKDARSKATASVKQLPPEGRFRGQALFLRALAGAGDVDTLATLLDREFETVVWPGIGPVQVDPYLARRILVAVSPRTGAACAGDQSAARVDCLDANGQRHAITWDAPPVSVSPSHHERWQDSLTAVFARKAPANEAAALVRRMTAPDTMPPYVALLMDAAERLWIQLPPGASDRGVSRYAVFDLGGRPVARQELPFDRLAYADRERVVGILIDDDGLEYIREHRLGSR